MDVRAIAAFEEIADIYKGKLRDNETAAQTYVKLVDYFPEYDKAPDRLMDAARLYDEKVGDLGNAFVVYERIEKNYPNHKKPGKQQSAKKNWGKRWMWK